MIEHPAAHEWCEFSNVELVDAGPAAHQAEARARFTVTIAACVMVLALIGGATVAAIELVEAASSSGIQLVRFR